MDVILFFILGSDIKGLQSITVGRESWEVLQDAEYIANMIWKESQQEVTQDSNRKWGRVYRTSALALKYPLPEA